MEPKKDYSTAILERKRAPNRLVVDDAEGGVAVDSSTVALSPGTMDALDLFNGDVVALRGKRRRETVYYAAKDESCPDGLARVNRVVRGNLRLRLGDLVTVAPCGAVKDAARVAISPFEDSVDGISGNLFDAYVKPYFIGARRPVRKGDRFVVHGHMHAVEFKVVDTDPTSASSWRPARRSSATTPTRSSGRTRRGSTARATTTSAASASSSRRSGSWSSCRCATPSSSRRWA
ncbi:hypothetical protein VPH35_034271 [Triticum aestivum]